MKALKKRLLSLALSAVLVCSLAPAALAAGPGLDNFKEVNTFTDKTFTDLADGAWYLENVQTAYELDLIQGTGTAMFSPNGNMTVGAALALACRLHSIYNTGAADFVQGSPWYQVYVDYAVDKGIITAGQFTDYNANATRRQFAAILAKALPEEALEAKNTVEDGAIPDLAAGSANYDDIYMLYRAGILTGNDAKGTFAPESTIGRSSVAAIVSRMAVPALRQSITLKLVPVTAVSLSGVTVGEGKTAAITAQVSPADATNTTLTWTSSNTGIATVNASGTVTGVKAGTATITATASNGVKGSCTVTVTAAPVEATGVTLSQTTLGLGVGAKQTLTATVQPSNAADKTVTWTSSNPAVATVSNGTVTGVKVGSATITAKTANGKTATCAVTVSQQGTRANPYPADGSVVIPYQEYSFHSVKNIRVDCVGELRGSAANALAQSENQFNEVPNSNQEWRFYEFVVTYVSCSAGEEVLEGSDIIYDDTFFTASGSSVNVAEKATLSHTFDGYGVFDVELYPGGSGTVVIGLLINKNAGDLLLRVPYNGGDSYSWLSLKPGTTGSLSSGSVVQPDPEPTPDPDPTPSGSGYYSNFPGVPDFGAIMGISPLVDNYDPAEGDGSYFYTSTAIERAGHMDNFATLYTNRLLASGFDYFGDFTNDDGSPVLIFTNGTYSVMMGASLISGIAGVMIVVTPE